MNVSELGEFPLIDRLTAKLRKVRAVELGIGDDAGVYEVAPGKFFVVTSDMAVEGVHFSRQYASSFEIGWKALAAAISDVAAMGAQPTFALVSLGLPRDTSVEEAEEVYRGINEASQIFYTQIIGGDTVESPHALVIDVAVFGEVLFDRYLTRSGAQPGDALMVTGTLGDSRMGLQFLQGGGIESLPNAMAESLRAAHLKPFPRVDEGLFLVERPEVHAMMDISDGLAGDLHHLCKMSNVGATVLDSKLPISEVVRRAAALLGEEPETVAVSGGEDYELLIAVAPDAVERLLADWKDNFAVSLSVVGGALPSGAGIWRERKDGRREALQPTGFSHFGSRETS